LTIGGGIVTILDLMLLLMYSFIDRQM
jgi:hypothetical protein